MNRHTQTRRRQAGRTVALLATAGSAAALAAGCASTPPAPNPQIQSAQQAIDDAERAQAAEHAAPELSQARSKLSAAKSAVQNEELDSAARLAEEARADAELASARTAAAKAEAANDEIRRANGALLDELQRSTTGGGTQ
jgi:hypothetical protein